MSKRKSNRVLKSTARMKRSAFEAIKNKTPNEIAASIRAASVPVLKQDDWKALKKRVFETYGYRCMKCHHLHSIKKFVNVDHIKPRKLFPDLAFDFDNLQVLCGRCNKEKGNLHCTDYRSKPCDAAGEWSDFNLSQVLRQL